MPVLVCTLVSPHVGNLLPCPKGPIKVNNIKSDDLTSHRESYNSLLRIHKDSFSATQSPDRKKLRRRAHEVELDLTPVFRRFGR